MRIPPALVLAVVLAAAAPAFALEKRAVLVEDLERSDWTLGDVCRISYYNVCTGWVWCWSGFGDDFQFGVVVENTCPLKENFLSRTILYVCSSAPFYGYTGTIAVHNVDENDCPVGVSLAVQPYLPRSEKSSPFQTVSWGGVSVPDRFAVIVTMQDGIGGLPNPASFGTDRPAAGPTGPQACETCYPVNRPIRSYMYGPRLSPICPGSAFNDGICDANLFWDIELSRAPTSVEESSWGKIKTLYR